ncbi:unnamed protein product, partial [Ectocarpus sp. 12 AP-2014]
MKAEVLKPLFEDTDNPIPTDTARPGSRASARRMKPVLPDKHNHHAEGVCSVSRGGGTALHAPCFGDVCGDLHHGEEGRGRRRRRARWREG